MLACVDGKAFVIAVDVRLGSPTFGRWIGLWLSRENQRILQVPCTVACGWMATTTTARLHVSCDEVTAPNDWQWLRWDDSELTLQWPETPVALASHSRRSRRLSAISNECLPIFEEVVHGASLARRSERQSKRRAVGTKNPSKPLILVIGSSGQLGRDLCRHLRSVGTVLGASRAPDRNQLLPVPIEVDISRPASLRQVVRQVRPQIIINASELTDVDRAEAEPRLAQLVNATAPAVLAEEAEKCGAAIVHYCSDMVFSGQGERPWRETDEAQPICQYSRTKLIGTEAIRASKAPSLILRSGWLYSTHGENYIRQTVDMSLYRNSMSQAEDHFGSPTSTSWLADVTAQILNRASGYIPEWLSEHGGLFHCTTLGYASRAEVAEHVLSDCRQHRMPVVTRTVQSVQLAELPSLATRPANCRLDCSRVAMQLGIELPRWQDQLTKQLSLMIDGSLKTMRALA